jgi:hypothetical protein
MAIVQGDLVALSHRNLGVTALSSVLQFQPPLVGRVRSVADGSAAVLWENGETTTVVVGVLDKLTAAAAPLDPARVVRVDLTGVELNSNSFRGGIVSQWRRQMGGEGAVGADLVVIKLAGNGQYFELPQAQVAAVAAA